MGGKVSRRERFLGAMDAVILWSRRVRLIEPHAPKAGQGRHPRGLAKMRRIYFLPQWFKLAEPQAEDAIYDSEAMRSFARVALGDEVVADESTSLRCRHLLEQHGLSHAICAAVADLWEERWRWLRAGTLVDATLSAAPRSTQHASAPRDPAMQQTRQGRNWHCGLELQAARINALSSIRCGRPRRASPTSPHPVRLQPILLPDARHGGGTKPHLLSQASGAPMSRGVRGRIVAATTARSWAELIRRRRPLRAWLRSPAMPCAR
jgi:hypothetical protein